MTRLKSVQRAGPSFAGLMLLALLPLSLPAQAGEVAIVHVVFHQAAGAWSLDVTLEHSDTGWDHYADAWRVVGSDGKVLGTRTLYHPHENEQPFTRSLGGVAIPAGGSKVYIEAHDKVHGWSPRRVEVDLGRAKGERFEVSR